LDTLLLLGLLAGLVWFWADSARAREQMLRRCRSLCEELNVQLLDQTVSLEKLRLARSLHGNMELRRWYAFEYSTDGADRWQGSAQQRGREVTSIHMAHPQGQIIIRDDLPLDH
jgi:hypothetical protein